MTISLRLAGLAPVLFAAVTAAGAASVDMASYFALTPGNWGVLRHDTTGELTGYVTSSRANGQVAQTWYRFDGTRWVFDSTELFSLTSRRMTYLGFEDDVATWLFEPALSFARRLNVGDAVTYKGAARNQTTQEVVPALMVFTFATEGLAFNGPAGAFANCIKVRQYSVQGDGSRDSVSISCPARNEVRTWISKIRDTADPVVEDMNDRWSATMIQAGDSNPPIP